MSSGGQINVDNERIILEPTGNFNAIQDIKEMLIPVGQNGTQLVQLQDITSIRKGYITPASQIVKVNGRNAISIHVNLTEGANIIALGEDVNRVTNRWLGYL